MKRRLQGIYWLGILITLAMAFAAIGVAAKLRIDDTRTNLSAMLRAASQWTLDSNDDLQSLADTIAGVSPPMRVTFLMDSGVILADSAEGANPDANHYRDREIADARQGMIGRSLRMSETSAAFVLYMARRVAPQLILRVSYPVFEIARLPAFYGAALLALFLVLYRLQRRAIARFAADQSRQFADVGRLLDGELGRVDAVFPEFQPSLDAIAYRVRRLREDHEEIVRTMDLRSDFITNASHELRSPLTSVRGYAELLEEDLADTPEERALCIRTIRGECDRMLSVINDILRLSKAERGTDVSADRREAAPIAQEVRQALLPRAAKKSIDLQIEGNALIRADERDIWEILYNLTDNAVRYGRQGGHVLVKLSENGIIVEDDGIGIDEKHLGHIFEQFYRVNDARDAEASGTGLGLSIVRAIVERCGGSIRAESTPGVGTRFILRLDGEAQS